LKGSKFLVDEEEASNLSIMLRNHFSLLDGINGFNRSKQHRAPSSLSVGKSPAVTKAINKFKKFVDNDSVHTVRKDDVSQPKDFPLASIAPMVDGRSKEKKTTDIFFISFFFFSLKIVQIINDKIDKRRKECQENVLQQYGHLDRDALLEKIVDLTLKLEDSQ